MLRADVRARWVGEVVPEQLDEAERKAEKSVSFSDELNEQGTYAPVALPCAEDSCEALRGAR